jgi:hypothetical protein
MDEKPKQMINRSSLRRYIDEENRDSNFACQQPLPISIDHLSSTSTISHKRRRSSTINEQTDLFSNNQHLLYNQNILSIPTTTRKRSIQDNYFLHEYDQSVRKIF